MSIFLLFFIVLAVIQKLSELLQSGSNRSGKSTPLAILYKSKDFFQKITGQEPQPGPDATLPPYTYQFDRKNSRVTIHSRLFLPGQQVTVQIPLNCYSALLLMTGLFLPGRQIPALEKVFPGLHLQDV